MSEVDSYKAVVEHLQIENASLKAEMKRLKAKVCELEDWKIQRLEIESMDLKWARTPSEEERLKARVLGNLQERYDALYAQVKRIEEDRRSKWLEQGKYYEDAYGRHVPPGWPEPK